MNLSHEIALNELIEKIKANDQNAFRVFFCKMQPNIFNFLYRYCLDYDVAKDLTQETFIKFWHSKDVIDPAWSPKSYLFKIARNLALNQVQRKAPSVSYDDNENLLVALFKHPGREYEQKFLMNDFKKAVLLLPERCRVIFILSRYHDFKYDEIASMLEISIQTVKNQMNKSLAILRKHLSQYID